MKHHPWSTILQYLRILVVAVEMIAHCSHVTAAAPNALDDANRNAQLEGKNLVVLCHARWNAESQHVMKETWNCSGTVAWLALDVDETREVSTQLSCEFVPTIVLFQNGAEIARHVGWMSKRGLIDWIEGPPRKQQHDKDSKPAALHQQRLDIENRMKTQDYDGAADALCQLWSDFDSCDAAAYRKFAGASDQLLEGKEFDVGLSALHHLTRKVLYANNGAREKLYDVRDILAAESRTFNDLLRVMMLDDSLGDPEHLCKTYLRVKNMPFGERLCQTRRPYLIRALLTKEMWAESLTVTGDTRTYVSGYLVAISHGEQRGKIRKDPQFAGPVWREVTGLFVACLKTGHDADAFDIAMLVWRNRGSAPFEDAEPKHFKEAAIAKQSLVRIALQADEPREEFVKWLRDVSEWIEVDHALEVQLEEKLKATPKPSAVAPDLDESNHRTDKH